MPDLPKIGSEDEKALRRLLKPRRRAPPPKSRQKFRTTAIIFSPVDEAVFSEALREAYPRVQFLNLARWQGPEIPLHRSLVECRDTRGADIIVPSDDEWRPDVGEAENPGWYYLANWPDLQIDVNRSHWDWGPKYYQRQWAWEPPTLTSGLISGTWKTDDPKYESRLEFIRKTWRILRRIATNHYKGGHPHGNALMGGDRKLTAESKGGRYWIGHHALEWCNAAPRRMLDGFFRPCDDWAPPQDEWYRKLRALVLEKYGPELGETPAER